MKREALNREDEVKLIEMAVSDLSLDYHLLVECPCFATGSKVLYI
jgi:hypothetical protein